MLGRYEHFHEKDNLKICVSILHILRIAEKLDLKKVPTNTSIVEVCENSSQK